MYIILFFEFHLNSFWVSLQSFIYLLSCLLLLLLSLSLHNPFKDWNIFLGIQMIKRVNTLAEEWEDFSVDFFRKISFHHVLFSVTVWMTFCRMFGCYFCKLPPNPSCYPACISDEMKILWFYQKILLGDRLPSQSITDECIRCFGLLAYERWQGIRHLQGNPEHF